MKRRKWDAKTKATIILQWLKGKSVAELWTEHQINQAQYYQWRDQLLAHAGPPLRCISKANGRRGGSKRMRA